MRTIVSEIIREKILLNTNEEVPHGTGIEIIQYKEPAKRGGITSIEANIYCEKTTHKGILIGKNGEKLKRIGSAARRDIERILGGQVNLKLWVKVKDRLEKQPRNAERTWISMSGDRHVKAEGIVLKETPLGENGKLLVIFTKEYGRITAAAKRRQKAGQQYGTACAAFRIRPFGAL